MSELTTALLIAAALALMVYCLVETVEAPRSRVRALPLPAWQLLLLVPFAGSLAWLFLGRPRAGHRIDVPGPGTRRRAGRRDRRQQGRPAARRAGHASAGSLRADWPVRPEPTAPCAVGPDDDPDFIAQLAVVVRQLRQDGGHPARTDDGDDLG